MDIFETVRQSNILQSYRHVVLGLSGGPDSVCLFDVLLRLQQELAGGQSPDGRGRAGAQEGSGPPFRIWPVHVNHMLRLGAADQDQAYVEELCASRGLELGVVKADCAAMAREQDLTPEEAGRRLRYKAFFARARELQEAGAPPEEIGIAVAHHGDDQAETILQRILRGTGTDGLAGMEPVRRDGSGFDILRPLLAVRREEIEAYCRERGLVPCQDQTNREPLYQRNRIRLELLPLMEEYNPKIVEALGRLARAAAEDKACLEALAESAGEKYLLERSATRLVYRMDLLKEPRALARRVLGAALKELGLEEDVTAAHFQAALELAESTKPSAVVNLPRGYRVLREYGRVVVERSGLRTRGSGKAGYYESQLGDSLGGPGDSAGDAESVGVEAGSPAGLQVQVLPASQYRQMEAELQSPEAPAGGRKTSARDEAPVGGWKTEAPEGRREGWAAFDYEALVARYGEGPERRLCLRSRREGDRLPLAKGRKKLQDVFVDDKIPRFRRDLVQMVALGDEVLWIPRQKGLVERARYAAGMGVGPETRKVLLLKAGAFFVAEEK